ncbi:MAG: ATP-dependent helicase, partial [Acholeplasmatales bacterium]|nr:ATP-dependent helicase [Acholeplasmatales bacterium]
MEYLNELNNDQFLAVTTNKKKVLVAAGAGSGKTKVLTTRIKYLIDSGVNINNIIAFTFTKKACDEMKYRLKDNDFENVYTFHSYCYKLIMENPEAFGFKDIPYVIDDGYKDILIKNILEDLKLNLNPKLFISYISKRKNGIDIKFDTSEDESLYNMIYYRFQEYLMNCGAIDFDDMLSLVVNNIDRLPNKYSIVNNLKYILVDECQDTNQIQFNLIKKLSKIHNNIFMVGDSNQLIYSFRSSDIKIITSFSEEADQVIILKENYRSSANILEYANNLIRNNNSKISMELFSN